MWSSQITEQIKTINEIKNRIRQLKMSVTVLFLYQTVAPTETQIDNVWKTEENPFPIPFSARAFWYHSDNDRIEAIFTSNQSDQTKEIGGATDTYESFDLVNVAITDTDVNDFGISNIPTDYKYLFGISSIQSANAADQSWGYLINDRTGTYYSAYTPVDIVAYTPDVIAETPGRVYTPAIANTNFFVTSVSLVFLPLYADTDVDQGVINFSHRSFEFIQSGMTDAITKVHIADDISGDFISSRSFFILFSLT